MQPPDHDDAALGHLNLVEFTREDTRWQSSYTMLEADGVLCFAGASDFPAMNNGVVRTDDTVPGAVVLERARAFFAEQGRGFSLWLRLDGSDTDLAEAADAVSMGALFDYPQMICRSPLPEQPLPEGVEIRPVANRADVDAYADIQGAAYETYGSPFAANRSHFEGRGAIVTSPHVYAALACLDGAPVGGAMILHSHGIAGVYWVGTIEAARGRGVAEAVTRHVTNVGFAQGAASVQLQASSMGEPIYRRMGYEELYRYQLRLAAPPT